MGQIGLNRGLNGSIRTSNEVEIFKIYDYEALYENSPDNQHHQGSLRCRLSVGFASNAIVMENNTDMFSIGINIMLEVK